jgi:hypothetical protein
VLKNIKLGTSQALILELGEWSEFTEALPLHAPFYTEKTAWWAFLHSEI